MWEEHTPKEFKIFADIYDMSINACTISTWCMQRQLYI